MPKDKRKKKYLQGMEHLKAFASTQPHENESQHFQQNSESVKTVFNNTKHSVLKKELTTAFVIMTFLFLALVILMYIDRTSTIMLELAEKITSFFVK